MFLNFSRLVIQQSDHLVFIFLINFCRGEPLDGPATLAKFRSLYLTDPDGNIHPPIIWTAADPVSLLRLHRFIYFFMVFSMAFVVCGSYIGLMFKVRLQVVV